MFRKTTIALTAAIASLCFAAPACAETFTSADGILSIELPNENWKQIEDPMKWIALSDGGSVITIDHFSNGEKLPEMSVADDHYVNVYQAVFSTQNEVFIITGSVADADKIPEIASTIISAKVLKYDTKLAVGKEKEVAASEFSLVPMDKTMYVTAEWLNVRRGCTVDDLVIGGFGRGAAVKVLGAVQRNGEDLGWYQVEYEGGTGYVSGSFLSEKKEDAGTDSADDTSYSGAVKTVYDENGSAYTLYEGTDGYWRDKSGTEYVRHSDTEFQVRDGNKILTTYYRSADDDVEVNVEGDPYDRPTLTVYDENGTAYTIYDGSDGNWHTYDGTTFVRLSDTEFQVLNGTKRVSTEYPDVEVNVEGDPYDNPSEIVFDEYGNSFVIYEGSDGYWHEEDGTAYVQLSDTEFQVKDGTRRVTTYYPFGDDDDVEVNVEGDPYGDTYDNGDEDYYTGYDYGENDEYDGRDYGEDDEYDGSDYGENYDYEYDEDYDY